MTIAVLENLRQLHDAMLVDLRAHYLGRVQTIEAFDPFPDIEGQDRLPLVTPALLLEIDSIDPGVEDGTERQALNLSFLVHCVLSFRTEQIQLELREFAADLLNHVRYNRWGFPAAVEIPTALGAQPAEFVPGLMGFDTWIARWEQVVFIGSDSWSAAGIPTAEVWFGIAPEIGTAHVSDYWRIDGDTRP